MPCCYVLYSPEQDQFYVGSTSLEIAERLDQHNSSYFEGSFTSKSSDWQLFLRIPCMSIVQARRMEAHLKKMKSRKYIMNLKAYPEMVEKLRSQYPN